MDEEQGQESDQSRCKACPQGVAMWMATFSDMAILLMAFFVLLIAFNNTEDGGAQMTAGKKEGKFGVQNQLPVVNRPEGDNVIAKTFSPAQLEKTLVKVLKEETTDIKPLKDIVLTRFNKRQTYTVNADIEALETALAKEIAVGRVRIREGKFKTVIEILSEDVNDDYWPGDYSFSGVKVREQDIQIYAKVADLQTTTEREIEVEYVSQQTKAGEQTRLSREAAFADQYQAIRQALVDEINKGQAEVLREDARIIIRLAEQGSFASGRAAIKPGFENILNKLGVSLRDVSGLIAVEGHTDSVPMAYNEQFRTNWDLSAARSAAVVEYLLGVTPQVHGNIMASGMADMKPLVKNNTAPGRSRNRRIEVIISAI
ncbi:MAG: OmpA family protein [Porticoccaceae bacterium]|nr:OmpA family protein [Porticoccaceae bacterium]